MLRTVVLNGLWITGLAIIVAGLSYYRYQAVVQGQPLRRQLGRASFHVVLYSGIVLITLGLAGTSTSLWETLIWLALMILSALGAVRAGRSTK